jgi:anaerobic selenocysteine-containing dehydrogenase
MSIGRRELLIGIGSAGAGLTLGRISHFFPLASPVTTLDWSPGDVNYVPSTCLLCPSHCGILGRVVDDRLVRIDGNPLHPVSRGGLCPKGRAGVQMLLHPDRLTGPLERTGPPGSNEFTPISWDTALARLTSRLKAPMERGESERIGILTGHVTGLMDEMMSRFMTTIGSPNLLREDYADGSAEVISLMQGYDAPPAYDLERSDLVLSFGAALSEAWWGMPQAATARDAESSEGPRWLQIDTRLSRTAAAANHWYPVRPGTYGVLALGILYILLKEGLYDESWVRHRVTGYEDWTDENGRHVPGLQSLVLRHGRPDDVSQRTSLRVDHIIELAKAFGNAERPVALWDHAVGWHAGGLADGLAIHALNVLAGRLNRPGGVTVQRRLPLTPLSQPVPSAGNGWPELDALLLYYSNPVASRPDPDQVKDALGKIPFVVSFSPFLDETARHADLVLPDHTYLERWQDAPAPASVPTPSWGLVQPIVPPLHDTRATGDLLIDLAHRLGGPVGEAFPWTSMESLVKERGHALAKLNRGSVFVPEVRRGELRELEVRGWWIPHGLSAGAFWKSLRESGGWLDPYIDDQTRTGASTLASGKVALFPAEARRRLAERMPGLVDDILPPGFHGIDDADGLDSDYPLQLLPYRLMTLSSGGTTLFPWLLDSLGLLGETAWEGWVEINPKTASDLGLKEGQQVRAISRHGSFEARLRLYAGAQPGLVNAPYGLHAPVRSWGAMKAFNPLTAVGTERDPVGGNPDWYSARVRLEPV